MKRAHYHADIASFLNTEPLAILGALTDRSQFDVTGMQTDAWLETIRIMKGALPSYQGRGKVYFEYEIPRLGGRIDALTVIDGVIFVIEFKVGADNFLASAKDQVCDYALDLKNFHETSHDATVAPILFASNAPAIPVTVKTTPQEDNLLQTLCVNSETLPEALHKILESVSDNNMQADKWETGRYSPTPTIIEAATALYGGHNVAEISRSDAGAENLTHTSKTVAEIIQTAKTNSQKIICFVTGVPGAGKTLVGLDIAAKSRPEARASRAVFLSGNAPLVNVLSEALVRDKVQRSKDEGKRITKGEAKRAVKLFVQNVHHFRDDCLKDDKPPYEHIALFDEAQRAWNLRETEAFIKRTTGNANFGMSEPEFLISCMDRHPDWAAVVCLVGGGQEINRGEAGIVEWFDALVKRFPDWQVYIPPQLSDDDIVTKLKVRKKGISFKGSLHLSTSLRSFRSERVSNLVKQILEHEKSDAKNTLREISKYPVALTRDPQLAKRWVREKARGSERYGMLVSSKAERLRPHAIDVRYKIDPVPWFLNGKDDVRSSYYLEDVATEFRIQGLEIDWACVTWDADFRYSPNSSTGWEHWAFAGKKWKHIKNTDNQQYQKNAYRVLLTRARQGMIIVVPEGDPHDPTRAKSFYDPTFEYLKSLGLPVV